MRAECSGPSTSARRLPDAVDPRRRGWLVRAVLGGAALGYGLVGAPRAHAASDSAFDTTLMNDLLRGIGGTPMPSTAIDLALPELTENGATVPVAVTSRLPRTEEILLVAEANPYPLVARFEIAPGTEAYISTRVKLARSGTVAAIVRADGRLYAVERETTVIEGGCGG